MADRRPPAELSRQPRLRPDESTHRANQAAVDMMSINIHMLSALGRHMTRGELFHVQMHMLYSLIDTMDAFANVSHETVLDMAKKYFESLRRERNQEEKE